jgi:ABC-type phosphate transport system substrate-binding protein
MKKRCLPILFASIILSGAIARSQEVAVIVNSSVKATSASIDDIRGVFNGDKSNLGDGSHVSPATLKGGAVHDAFLKQYVGKSDSAFRAAWRSLVFSGQGAMPKTLDSESAMVEYIASTPGTIGYVSKETEHSKVKTLVIK